MKKRGLVVSTALALFMLGLLGLRVGAVMAQSGVPLPSETDLEKVRAGIAEDGMPEDVWIVISDVVDVSGPDLSPLWFAEDRVPVYRVTEEFLDPDATSPLSARVEQANAWALVFTRDSVPIGAAFAEMYEGQWFEGGVASLQCVDTLRNLSPGDRLLFDGRRREGAAWILRGDQLTPVAECLEDAHEFPERTLAELQASYRRCGPDESCGGGAEVPCEHPGSFGSDEAGDSIRSAAIGTSAFTVAAVGTLVAIAAVLSVGAVARKMRTQGGAGG